MLRTAQAFTCIELMAVLVVLALLGVFALPLFAAARADSDRAGCFSNLRQINRGAMSWAADQGDRIPWLTPVAEGGTFTNALRTSAVWLEFLTFSNELSSPRLLACPADGSVKVASIWISGPGALTTTGYRHQSVSYLIGLHTSLTTPASLLCADRNVDVSRSSDCGTAFITGSFSLDGPDPALGWTNAVHGASGHIATMNGAVSYTGRTGWHDYLHSPGSGSGAGDPGPQTHILRDR